MGNSIALSHRARALPYTPRIVIESELKRLLNMGIISEDNPGECPCASPIIVFAKNDGTLRMCVDYSHLNQMTIKDANPLQRIEEIFTSLHNAYCFLAWDLLMG